MHDTHAFNRLRTSESLNEKYYYVCVHVIHAFQLTTHIRKPVCNILQCLYSWYACASILRTPESLYAIYNNVCIHDTHALDQYAHLKACVQYITMPVFMIGIRFNTTHIWGGRFRLTIHMFFLDSHQRIDWGQRNLHYFPDSDGRDKERQTETDRDNEHTMNWFYIYSFSSRDLLDVMIQEELVGQAGGAGRGATVVEWITRGCVVSE
jgi:hypothetical protein